ncbi:hypothetical protein GTHT12_00789 [Geobacillus thermodenitrificans]|nr:hypothetical protein GTHT12_00789 [Geobacillus thermodenitrificans]
MVAKGRDVSARPDKPLLVRNPSGKEKDNRYLIL